MDEVVVVRLVTMVIMMTVMVAVMVEVVATMMNMMEDMGEPKDMEEEMVIPVVMDITAEEVDEVDLVVVKVVMVEEDMHVEEVLFYFALLNVHCNL